MEQQTAILDRYGVIGYPIAHSKSPVIHQQFAEQTQQPMVYEPFAAPPEQLESIVRQFQRAGGKGLNVTVPHKARITRLVDELSEAASIAGACNTLVIEPERIVGHNTDGIGFVRDVTDNWQFELAGKRILIFGAGGATQGILAPVLEHEPETVVIANRSIDRASALANHFGTLGKVEAIRLTDTRDIEPFDLVINATSAGLQGEMPPFPRAVVDRKRTACYDLSYALSTTPFVQWAQQCDAVRTRAGWGLLIEQAAESFSIWRGVRPDTADVLKRLPASN